MMRIVVMRYYEKMNLLSVPDDDLSSTSHKELELTTISQVESIHELHMCETVYWILFEHVILIILLQILLNDENEYDDEIFRHNHNVQSKIQIRLDIISMESKYL
ncbi:MAG: hypothetical protein IKW93_02445 [Bacteroidales bacterium]|nr:hypothetical protein [Bacteroidales bacterium]